MEPSDDDNSDRLSPFVELEYDSETFTKDDKDQSKAASEGDEQQNEYWPNDVAPETSSVHSLGYHETISDAGMKISADCRSATRSRDSINGMVISNQPLQGYCVFEVTVTASLSNFFKGGLSVGVLYVENGEELSLPSSVWEADHVWEEKGYSMEGDTYTLCLSIDGELTFLRNGIIEHRIEEASSSDKDLYIIIDHYGSALATEITRAVGNNDQWCSNSTATMSTADTATASPITICVGTADGCTQRHRYCPKESQLTVSDNEELLQLIHNLAVPLFPTMSESLEPPATPPPDFEVLSSFESSDDYQFKSPPISRGSMTRSPLLLPGTSAEDFPSYSMQTDGPVTAQLKLEILRLTLKLQETKEEANEYKKLYEREVSDHLTTKQQKEDTQTSLSLAQYNLKSKSSNDVEHINNSQSLLPNKVTGTLASSTHSLNLPYS